VTATCALAVFEGAAQHGQTDDVRMPRGVGKGGLTVHPNQDGHVVLEAPRRPHAFQSVMGAVEGDLLAVKEPVENLDRLSQAGLAGPWRVEGRADGGVLGEGMPGADTHLEAPPREVVDACELLGQMHRVVKIVVQHKGTHPDTGGGLGHSHQGRQRRPAVYDMVPGVEDVEAGLLSVASLRPQLGRGALPHLESKAEGSHPKRLFAKGSSRTERIETPGGS
jgi:hypothetical protein